MAQTRLAAGEKERILLSLTQCLNDLEGEIGRFGKSEQSDQRSRPHSTFDSHRDDLKENAADGA
ncbi:MAG: hypothetical protein AAGG02_19835 [Cyanobacteria bacterium P01_H01_bin.15]